MYSTGVSRRRCASAREHDMSPPLLGMACAAVASDCSTTTLIILALLQCADIIATVYLHSLFPSAIHQVVGKPKTLSPNLVVSEGM